MAACRNRRLKKPPTLFMRNMAEIYTIGHSGHSIETFIALLEKHVIKTVFDVRSRPYSRIHPQFRYKPLARSLENAGIQYVFAGKQLGARPDDPDCYEHGRVSFARLARRQEFAEGLDQVLRAAAKNRVCLMCAEKEPLCCHRTLLVCRNLKNKELFIYHILANGSLEEHSDTEKRMMRIHGTNQKDLFGDPGADPVEAAYELRIESLLKGK